MGYRAAMIGGVLSANPVRGAAHVSHVISPPFAVPHENDRIGKESFRATQACEVA
jgi:hypothetical protein